MKNLIEVRRQNPHFNILWALNNVCNYNCSYCSEINKAGNHKADLETAKYVVDNIFAQYYQHTLFNFIFTGGEPTAWKHFIELCKYIKSKENSYRRCVITINTNMSRPYEWWEEHYMLFNMILASFQVEFADKDQFLKKMEFGNRLVMTARLSMHKERFWEVVDFGTRLIDNKGSYRVEWVPLFDELGVGTEEFEYTDPGQKKFLDSHSDSVLKRDIKPIRMANHGYETITLYDDGSESFILCNDIVMKKQNYFKDWHCRLGLDSIFISFEGDIEGGTCRLRNLGNIFDKEFEFPEEPLICPKDYCHCGADIMIPKRKDSYDEDF